jgi:acetyl-CoA synthetase
MSVEHGIENLLHEERRFEPSKEFVANAIATPELYEQAKADRLEFWADQARKLHWHKPFTQTLDWSNAPFAKWFHDGELNISYNCLDRHVEAGWGKRVALFFEGEPGDTKVYTYLDLLIEVKKAANLLLKLGIEPGDRVAIYMPMIPEAIIAMQAVARVGAVHSVIFGGFSADSLASRIQDAEAKLVITADGGYRKGKASLLKPAVDEALAERFTVSHVGGRGVLEPTAPARGLEYRQVQELSNLFVLGDQERHLLPCLRPRKPVEQEFVGIPFHDRAAGAGLETRRLRVADRLRVFILVVRP